MEDDFTNLTTEDKASAAYAVCVGGWITAGLIVGGAAGGVGAPVGAAAGAVWSKMTCPAIIRKYKQIIQDKQMNDGDFTSMMNDFRRQYPGKSRKDLLAVAAMLAREVIGGRYDDPKDQGQTLIA
ncbi:hypothetical protein [Novosphingobium sp.]|uniref:hypothetical protein n=1 Tax=Novosphingobium sp. TaxID=1874826 RepID=UPI003567749A